MTERCPICETEAVASAPLCAGCGFPVELFGEAASALASADDSDSPATTTQAPTEEMGRRRAVPESDASERAARDLMATMRLLERVGAEPPDILSEMQQAALVEADGRTGEALSLLRNAQTRAVRQLSRLLDHRVAELETRRAALVEEGVRVELAPDPARIRASLTGTSRDQPVEMLNQAEERLGKMEADWRGLKALLLQVDRLTAAAESVDRLTADVAEEVARVRALIAQPAVGPETLDEAAAGAGRVLSKLHEQLPPVIEEELGQHLSLLSAFAGDHEPSRRARTLHAETARHLKYGRLADATASLKELRGVIEEISAAPAPGVPPTPLVTFASPSNGSAASSVTAAPEPLADGESNEPEALERLLTKARLLATRVRSLPKDSEVAFVAAGEIRRATDLLRNRNLSEADATLTELMKRLDERAAPGAR